MQAAQCCAVFEVHHNQLLAACCVLLGICAGNSGKDACLASPASAPSALTVAAIDDKVSRWAYANW